MPIRSRLATLVPLLAVPWVLGAQGKGAVLDVQLRDALGTPVPLATVIAESDGVRQLRITNDSGRTNFALKRDGTVAISVRRIGYTPQQATVSVREARQSLELRLERSTPFSLDTVRVLAARGVSGIVVASATQMPVAGATITLAGAGEKVVSAADGSFTLPLRSQRSITLSVRAPGYAPSFRTERLERAESGQFLILLDSLGSVPNVVLAGLWDAERRMAWRGTTDLAVGGRELRATGASNVFDALRVSPSSTERGLRVGDNVCLFVNGQPAPGQTLETFPVETIRTIELYERGGQMIRTLVDAWPQGMPCGRGQSAIAPSGAGAVRYAVVWTY